jgi:hypothetical protein
MGVENSQDISLLQSGNPCPGRMCEPTDEEGLLYMIPILISERSVFFNVKIISTPPAANPNSDVCTFY